MHSQSSSFPSLGFCNLNRRILTVSQSILLTLLRVVDLVDFCHCMSNVAAATLHIRAGGLTRSPMTQDTKLYRSSL